jgi:hypothetical protein
MAVLRDTAACAHTGECGGHVNALLMQAFQPCLPLPSKIPGATMLSRRQPPHSSPPGRPSPAKPGHSPAAGAQGGPHPAPALALAPTSRAPPPQRLGPAAAMPRGAPPPPPSSLPAVPCLHMAAPPGLLHQQGPLPRSRLAGCVARAGACVCVLGGAGAGGSSTVRRCVAAAASGHERCHGAGQVLAILLGSTAA